ncbi:MAG: ABC transporter ATP-binding protein [Gemmatimonadota bacterium]|nr:ABC transporter ATP-binding protein [Gemmatimonadota bacterium]
MTTPVLEVRSLGVTLARPAQAGHADGAGDARADAARILTDVSFDVTRGSSVGIVGPSGAGKSTLGLALMRLLPRTMRLAPGGSIRLGERDLAALDAEAVRDLRGQRLAMVFQEPVTALNPAMTVGDQLAEAVLVHRRASAREARERAVEMLDRVGIPAAREAAERFPHEFSGGMRQRLLLAMPLMLDPELIIADEPTTALDPVRQSHMLDLLDGLRKRSGTALLLITHDLDLVGERCERVIVLDAGRVVEDGATGEILARPASVAARRLAEARLPFGTPGAGGHASGAARSPATPAAPLMDVRDLHVTYPERRRTLRSIGAVPAVQGVSLHVNAGEVLGVVGESGCGKTSLALALLRLVPSRSAALRFRGDDLAALEGEPMRRLRRQLQYMPQDAGASLSPHLSCGALVAEGPLIHGLCGEAEARERARTLLLALGLPPGAAAARPGHLSTGQRQRVALARALAVEPDLLVCDEPVSSVDPPTRLQLLDTLARLRDERGLALLFISHDVPAVARIADRVLVMRQGRVVETGPTAEVFASPAEAYTRALLAAVPRGVPRR